MTGRDDSRLTFTVSRKFDAPRERVWAAWTRPALLERWWGPAGGSLLHATGVARSGAMFLYGYEMPDGSEIWGRLLYRDLWEPTELVYVASFTDRRGTPVRNPNNRAWPMDVLTRVNFDKQGGATNIMLRATPQAATDAEKTVFENSRFDMKDAFAASFERLDHILSETL